MNGYYSVFNPRGEKIADCGSQKDAVTLLNMRNNRWEGHYYMFNPFPGSVIDVTSPPSALPTNEIIMVDGYSTSEGVGSSWKEIEYTKQLPENQQQPLDL